MYNRDSSINYYNELIKMFHPDLNNNSKFSMVITKIINRFKNDNDVFKLKNLYDRLVVKNKVND